jgi:DNA-binding CsgD family transcriptional regulator
MLELIRSSDQFAVDPFQGLTAKQCEVLDLLIEHKTSKEISRMLGISPHTVDQRIMLARAKLHVATRNEVAQAYRRLLAGTGSAAAPATYQRSIYGSSRVADPEESRHDVWREDADTATSVDLPVHGQVVGVQQVGIQQVGTMPHKPAGFQPGEPSGSYYHVLPEAFDGRVGTLMRLGAIAMITVFLNLVILGGLAIYSELSHMLDG